MKPFFLAGQHGALFAQWYLPESGEYTQTVLHIPAFAEEMNKSRALVASQARAWSARGYAVLCIDYYGTGDSEGEFAEATWAQWLDDVNSAINWLQNQGSQHIALWGLRTGCLLALDFMAQYPNLIDRLIAWQPVLNGDSFVTQFLRLRVAAAMLDSSLNQEKVSDLKQRLFDGEALEVAGYQLNQELIKPLSTLRADQLGCSSLSQVDVFEITAQANSPTPLPLQNWLTQIQAQGVSATLHRVCDNPFWSSQEIVNAPKLIEATTHCLQHWSAHGR